MKRNTSEALSGLRAEVNKLTERTAKEMSKALERAKKEMLESLERRAEKVSKIADPHEREKVSNILAKMSTFVTDKWPVDIGLGDDPRAH